MGEVPRLPGVPGKFASAAFKSDKPPTLDEIPRGLKLAPVLQCGVRLECSSPTLSHQGEDGLGCAGSGPQHMRQAYKSPVSPWPAQSRDRSDGLRGNKEGGPLGPILGHGI